MGKYDSKITLKKAAQQMIAPSIVLAIAWLFTQEIPTTIEEWKVAGPVLAVGFLGAFLRAASNWWKHNSGGPPNMLIAFGGLMLACLALSGCQSTVKTTFAETVGPDGTMDTQYTATSRGDVDTTVHSYAGEYGGEVTRVAVGQDMSGLTSPAHLEAASTLNAILPSIIQSIVAATTGTGATQSDQGSDTPLLDRIERIEALILRLSEYLPTE